MVARRQGDRLRLGARRRAVGLGGERGRRDRAQGVDGGGPRRRAVVGTWRRDRVSRDHWRRPRRRRRRARASRYESPARLTGAENVFAFRASWASPTDFFYVSDGKIRKRSADGGSAPQTIEFTATMQVTRAETAYPHRKRDFTSTTPRPVLGIVRPVISPDGKQIAFAAVGDIYVMPVGGASRSTSRRMRRSTPIRRGRPTARSWSTRPTRTANISSSGSATCAPARAGRSPR